VHAISLCDVSKLWGSTRTVDRVSFDAAAGSFVVLLGPSGCGKSTTLRLIAGLEEVDEGAIFIDGKDVTALPPSLRHVAMVFQSYALFPHLSVAENILFGLKVRRIPRFEARARLDRVANLLGIGALLARKPSQLSGGQQQRVALGRAIVAEQPLCLMDEPLSNLDAQLRQDMRKEIRALQQQLGMTMIYVTHDQAEAMSMADRVILLQNGRVEQDAPPAELYARPASIFAARFIGTPPMNLLPLANGADGAVVQGTEGPTIGAWRADGLTLGLRPESVTLGESGRLMARVTEIEYLGADTIVGVVVGANAVAVRLSGRTGLTIGETVWLDWKPEAVHLFDTTSGRRIEQVHSRQLTTSMRAHA